MKTIIIVEVYRNGKYLPYCDSEFTITSLADDKEFNMAMIGAANRVIESGELNQNLTFRIKRKFIN